MEKQFAKMVKSPRGGAICLEKNEVEPGATTGTPITYNIVEVNGGAWLFMGTTRRRGYSTLSAAIHELFSIFENEMEKRGYELRVPGGYAGNDGEDIYWPEDTVPGWWDTNNVVCGPEFPLSDYPVDPSEWVRRGITHYVYDNYRVTICTSNWKEVQL